MTDVETVEDDLMVDTGRFQVEIKSFTLPSTAPPAGEDDEPPPEEEEEDKPTRQVWASVNILHEGEKSSHWWGDTEPEKIQTDYVVVEDKQQEDEDNPDPTPMSFSQLSRDIPLRDSELSKLGNSTVVIKLYEGASRDPDEVKLLGTAEIAVMDLLVDTALSGVFALELETPEPAEPVEGEEGEEEQEEAKKPTIEVDLSLDDEFAEGVRGGKLVTIGGLSIASLPENWTLTSEDGVPATELAADEALNNMSYTVEVPILAVNSKGQLLPPVVKTLEGGKLIFEVDEPEPTEEEAAAPAAEAAEGADGEEAAAAEAEAAEGEEAEAPPAKGTWRVVWDDEVATTVFMLKKGVVKWMETIKDGGTFNVKLKREAAAGDAGGGGKKGKGKAEDSGGGEGLECMCNFDLLDLLDAGSTELAPSSELSGIEEEGRSAEDAQAQFEVISKLRTAGTNVGIGISLSSPFIVAPASTPKPLLKPCDLIPTRPPPPAPERDASQDFRTEVKSVVSMLADEMVSLFAMPEGEDLSPDERRRKLLYHLNTGGKYNIFKEKLKKNVVRIVRDHFPQAPAAGPANGSGGSSGQDAFYSELYVYLMEQVHTAVNDAFKRADDGEAPPAIPKPDDSGEKLEEEVKRLLVLAEEAEAGMEWERAAQYHRDRVTAAEKIGHDTRSDMWFDYGIYCLRRGEVVRAAECLRECIAIEPKHVPALQAYGALLVEQKQFEEGEVYLKGAIAAEAETSGSHLASTRSHALLALYFECEGNDYTGKLMNAELGAACRAGGDISRGAVCQAVAEYLLDCHLPLLALRALDVMQKTVKQGVEKSVFRLSMRLLRGRQAMLCEDWDRSKETLTAATEIDPNSAEAWTLLGGLQYVQGLHKDAKESYALALKLMEQQGQPAPLQLYLRLGLLFLESGEPGAAREVYLRGCRAAVAAEGAVASLWLGVGTACLRLEEWEAAEQCLAEANILNNQNEKVWGYLALLCMTVSPARPSEADQALEQALRHGLQLPGLLRELGNGYVAADKLDVAEKVLRRSLAAQDSNLTRSRLADVLTAQNSFEAAFTQYRQVYESATDDQERTTALQQCADILQTLGRAEEAKEYQGMVEEYSGVA